MVLLIFVLYNESMFTVPIENCSDYIGKQTGESDWFQINQVRINQFADVTGDQQFIHIDSEKATPLFGATIAHGFLTLSLLSKLTKRSSLVPEGVQMAFNYGLDRVRFINPVLVDSFVKATTRLISFREKEPGNWLFKNEVTMQIKGQEKPAFVADTLTLFVLG